MNFVFIWDISAMSSWSRSMGLKKKKISVDSNGIYVPKPYRWTWKCTPRWRWSRHFSKWQCQLRKSCLLLPLFAPALCYALPHPGGCNSPAAVGITHFEEFLQTTWAPGPGHTRSSCAGRGAEQGAGAGGGQEHWDGHTSGWCCRWKVSITHHP